MKKDCHFETKCLNCSGNHAATDRKCPTYIFKAEVVATHTRERIPMSEAEDKVRERMRQDGQSYSAVVRRNHQNTQPRASLLQPAQAISHTSDLEHTGVIPKSNRVSPPVRDGASQEWHQTRRSESVTGQGDAVRAQDDAGLVRNRFEGLSDVSLESDIRTVGDSNKSGGSCAKEENSVVKMKCHVLICLAMTMWTKPILSTQEILTRTVTFIMRVPRGICIILRVEKYLIKVKS